MLAPSLRKFKAIGPNQYTLRLDLHKGFWQDDDSAKTCPAAGCGKEFGFFTRQHHCRACGVIFCDKHCSESAKYDKARVCVECIDALAKLNKEASEKQPQRNGNGNTSNEPISSNDDFKQTGKDSRGNGGNIYNNNNNSNNEKKNNSSSSLPAGVNSSSKNSSSVKQGDKQQQQQSNNKPSSSASSLTPQNNTNKSPQTAPLNVVPTTSFSTKGPQKNDLGATKRNFKIVKPKQEPTKTSPPVAAVYGLKIDLGTTQWQDDAHVQVCPAEGCGKEFSFFRRMHHCRACGVIYCDEHCPEDEQHDERVCVNCTAALAQVNKDAQDEVQASIEAAIIATQKKAVFEKYEMENEDYDKLATNPTDPSKGRVHIMQEESDTRVILLDDMKEERQKIDERVRLNIQNVIGSVAQLERRRNRPIYGVRGGVLKLRVQRMRNLQPVKPDMTCYPFVVVEVDYTRVTSPVAECANCKQMTVSKSAALDFRLDHEFCFDVEDDRVGVHICVMDKTSVEGVPVLIGIAYLNIRKMNVIEELPTSPQNQAGGGKNNNKEQDGGAQQQPSSPTRSGATNMKKASSATTRPPAAAAAAGGGNDNDDEEMIEGSPKANNREFAKFIEKGTATRALCAFDGHVLSTSQINVSWTFHPYKQDTTSRLAKQNMCHVCKQRDAPGYCTCGDIEKEDFDEEFIKKELRRIGGELHSQEMEARARVKNKSKQGAASSEPFGNLQKPTLHSAKERTVETCCC